jgi:hypothetical protein
VRVGEDRSTFGVDGLSYSTPAFDLFVGEQTRHVNETMASRLTHVASVKISPADARCL